jgi:tubulin--tyrosine ligase-like protein 12
VNQFPFERVVTVKDLLAVVSRRAGDGKEDPDTLERSPKWLPVTYNLETEITQFVSYFQQREKK